MDSSYLARMGKVVTENSTINSGLYSEYSVKRGLRNENGTGVLVGLTNVGDVHGYIIDEGEKVPAPGRLSYRGIDIMELVEGFQAEGRSGFEETAFLLLFGRLPTACELDEFNAVLAANHRLPDYFAEDMIFKAPSRDIMNKLARSVLASYSYDDNPDDISIDNVIRQSVELISRFPTMVAYGYQAKSHYFDGRSLYVHRPQENLNHAENFLYMIRPDNQFSKLESEILDLSLVLHAEHGGGNNSTFTTHVVASSETDTYSCIAAAVGSLKGPLHGGANLQVKGMMDDLKSQVKDWSSRSQVEDYLVKVLRKEAYDGSGLIYGVGHAVYTVSDPRAVLLKEKARALASEKGREEEFELFNMVEAMSPVLFNEIKKSNKIVSANVDFYSGLVYDMLNIPYELFTPIFAIARVAGWCAHLLEEIINGGRIMRPAYKYVLGKKNYLPMSERE